MAKMHSGLVVILFMASAWAQSSPTSRKPLWTDKPDVAAFEKIENDHFAAADRFIATLVAAKGPRTVGNTLAPFDEAVREINTAAYFAGLMQQVHPDATFRDHATTMYTKAVTAQTAISLNRDVYNAMAALDVSKADAATKYYVERQLLEFKLAGVNKDDATRAKLKDLNEKLAEEVSVYDRNISDDQKVVEATVAELDGLPQDYIDRHKPDANGKVKITTNYPDIFPVFQFAKSDDLRRRMNIAFEMRAYPKNADVLKQMIDTRYQIATLLGYSSWADYNAADKMIAKGQNIGEFIDRLGTATHDTAAREFAMVLAEKQKTHPDAKEVWDYEGGYYKEQLRRSQYTFDSQSVRPYLPYKQVRQGILDTASKLFHLTFKQEEGVVSWDPTVETWDVYDNGKMIGRFYLDMHPRPGKFSHAEMVQVLDGIRGKQLPEATLVCNFPAPTDTDAGLMDIGDVETFFHEFGHLMHFILAGQQQWAGVAGISMESDFAEAPSQMLEELIRSPLVLQTFARHYKTGEVMPLALIEKMNRAGAFGRAGYVSTQDAYSAISYELYKGDPKDIDPDKITEDALHRFSFSKLTPDTHMWASFGHLGGYSSAYYTYMWDEVIALDFFAQF
ncbi:MAG TPA: M3 family metallopeptidase, partial [Terriglobales bacterium]|nr:M3 family metallopeptidase [Terriglobales bacterium]